MLEIPKQVTFSIKETAPQLSLSRDLLEVTGCRAGYRMSKATDSVYAGNWYWECEILEALPNTTPIADNNEDGTGAAAEEQPHFRVGWATKQGNIQAPVGYDKHSFGYRDVSGSKIYKCERVDHYGQVYGPGDIIGCMICLPVLPEHMQETSLNGSSNPLLQGGVYPHPFLHREDSYNSASGSAAASAGGVGVGGGGIGSSSGSNMNNNISSGSNGGNAGGEEEGGIEDEVLRKELEALGNYVRFFKNGKDQGPAYAQIVGGGYGGGREGGREGGRGGGHWSGVDSRPLPPRLLGMLSLVFHVSLSSSFIFLFPNFSLISFLTHHLFYLPPPPPLPSARYYPAASIFLTGRVRGNFGPSWICPPETSIPFSPMSALKESLKRDELNVHNQGVNERRAALAARRRQQQQQQQQQLEMEQQHNRKEQEEREGDVGEGMEERKEGQGAGGGE